MKWYELFDGINKPDDKQIAEFINNPLWKELNTFLQDTYQVLPEKAYSACSMQAGWNVKYRKSGKSLCTLYPMEGDFIALVVTAAKQVDEVEAVIPSCTDYIQELYKSVNYYNGGKWLMVEVRNEKILEDVKSLIKIRVKPKEK